jgi:hypothetical protein
MTLIRPSNPLRIRVFYGKSSPLSNNRLRSSIHRGSEDFLWGERLPQRLTLSRREVEFGHQVVEVVRSGKLIRLKNGEKYPFSPENDQAVYERYTSRINTIRKRHMQINQLAPYFSRLQLLRQSISLVRSLEGKTPNCFQVLAVGALLYGLNSTALSQQVRTMQKMWAKETEDVRWVGRPRGLLTALNIPLPRPMQALNLAAGIEQTLLRCKNGGISTSTIVQGLGLPGNKENRRAVNYVIQLLIYTGHVRKLPMKASGSSSEFMWIHGSYANPMINYPCVPMSILDLLYREPKHQLKQIELSSLTPMP